MGYIPWWTERAEREERIATLVLYIATLVLYVVFALVLTTLHYCVGWPS